MNTNSKRDDSYLNSNNFNSNRNQIDLHNNYNDEDDEEEDLSLYKTAIYSKETPKDALIAKTASHNLHINNLSDNNTLLISPQSNNNSNNSINSCKYNSSNNSIQSTSSGSAPVTTSSPSIDTPFRIPSVKINSEEQNSFNEILFKNDKKKTDYLKTNKIGCKY